MSTMTLAQIRALAAQAAETGADMTQVQKGGGGKLLPVGKSLGRLVEYIEYGNQPQEFEGKAKAPAPEFRLAFELYDEGYTNDDGTPYVIRTFDIAESRNEKAKAFKLFKALNWKNTATHFAQLVGELFLVDIIHVTPKGAGAKPVSRINLDGFLPPLDPRSKKPYDAPPLEEKNLQLFLWEYPTVEGWAALHIEGQRDDGTSKNYLQSKILGALNFPGSALESLLLSTGTKFERPADAPAAGEGELVAPEDEPEATVEAAVPAMPMPE